MRLGWSTVRAATSVITMMYGPTNIKYDNERLCSISETNCFCPTKLKSVSGESCCGKLLSMIKKNVLRLG